MSSFFTPLSIPQLDQVIKELLPKGSTLEKVSFDPERRELFVFWSNNKLVTPYTFHLEFSAKLLETKSLPAGVTAREPTPHPAQFPPETTKPVRGRRGKQAS